jgi:hypothetical protein
VTTDGFKTVAPFLLLISRLADLVGFGVAVATGMQYLENFPERVYKSMLFPLMMEDNRAGKHNQTVMLPYQFVLYAARIFICLL